MIDGANEIGNKLIRQAPLLGVNVPWFSSAYGHDLGRSPIQSSWPVEFRIDEVTALLETLHHYQVRTVRIWLFERAEGLQIDGSCKVLGLDPFFKKNLTTLCALLRALGMKAYWTLLDANSVLRDDDRITRTILTDPDVRASFTANALRPILDICGDIAWGVDICNEPEALMPREALEHSACWERWSTIKESLIALALTAQSAGVQLVSVGSGFTEGQGIIERYTGVTHHLTAIDYHTYRTGGSVTMTDPRRYPSQKLILGEVGHPRCEQLSRHAEWKEIQQAMCLKLVSIIGANLHGAFLWYCTCLNSADPHSLFFMGEASPVLAQIKKHIEKGLLRAD